jgi:hypothetical protein
MIKLNKDNPARVFIKNPRHDNFVAVLFRSFDSLHDVKTFVRTKYASHGNILTVCVIQGEKYYRQFNVKTIF